jgi:heme-degrading monooxygenase HmoA
MGGILRSWTARATTENVPRYVSYFERTLGPELLGLDGFRGATISTGREPDAEGHTLIRVVTRWASMEAIGKFAGDTPSRAVVEPAARALLASFDEDVLHTDERLTIVA